MYSDKLENAEPLSTIRIPGNPSLPTRHRWRLQGVLDANAKRIRLECWKIGGRLVTTPEAVDRFIVALSADADAVEHESESDVARRNRETRRALEAIGI